MHKFVTITVFGERGRYGAQAPGIDAPVWGNSQDDLFSNISLAVRQQSPTMKRDLYAVPLLDEAAQGAG